MLNVLACRLRSMQIKVNEAALAPARAGRAQIALEERLGRAGEQVDEQQALVERRRRRRSLWHIVAAGQKEAPLHVGVRTRA